MSRLLDGRVALVTGAATGLGAAIAWRLADAGAIGLAFDIAERWQDLPQGWVAHKGDVSENVDLLDATDKIRQEFGRLDVVVANAGLVPPWRDTENINFDEWDQVFAVNVKGVAATIRLAVPLMKERGGSILAMGSLNSHCAHASQCLYTASKHAVLGIVRATALDLGRYGIRVNALGPGPVATDALVERVRKRAANGGPSTDETLEQYASDTALGRMVTKEDVARAALFLVSDQSGGITGQILPVDAGLP
jgi:NAD(P)-dependent dehydrogenase (short-subunit alcohol dehydrogenase family)